jgi:peptide/nickel transport system permease protein
LSSGNGSLPRYIGQRLLLIIPMIWVLLTLVFVLLRVAPGDPVSASVGGRLSEDALEERREALGLNRPLWEQYLEYLGDVARLDFGQSISDNQQVTDVIKNFGGGTLTLTIAAFVVALLLGIPFGLLAARFRDTPGDVVIRLFGIVTYAAPIFYTGMLLQLLFSTTLGWLPPNRAASGFIDLQIEDKTHILLIDAFLTGSGEVIIDVLKHLILPAVTLGLLLCGIFIRMVRVNVLQTLQSDYVEAARARGVPEGKVLRAHALRNALVPVVTIIGLQVALAMAGAVLTEATFDWPGIGNQLVHYLEARDYTAVQGIISLFAVVVVVVSILVDVVNALIDPRVRYS